MSTPTRGIAAIDWRGPRPIDSGEIAGRERDRRELLDACEANRIVEVTAPSGVGKTSFVNTAIPYLEARGKAVRKSIPWDKALTRLAQALGPEATLEDEATALYSISLGLEVGTDVEDLESLALGQGLVVIFDQTEELLRYRSQLGTAFLEVVAKAARISSGRVTHVVIARSEFVDKLRPLETGVVPWHLRLDEITDRGTIAEIIVAPAKLANVQLERELVRRLYSWWEAARRAPEARSNAAGFVREGLGSIGLLHLQALLWSFKTWAVVNVGPAADHLSDEDLLAFAAATLDTAETSFDDRIAGASNGARLIEQAILGYVRDTISSRLAPERAVNLTDTWISAQGEDSPPPPPPLRWHHGPELMVARVVASFSSAGYKIPQALSSLIPLALTEEFGQHDARALREHLARIAADGAKIATIRERYEDAQTDGTLDVRYWLPLGHEVTRELAPAGVALSWGGNPKGKDGWVPLEMVYALEAGLRDLSSPEANLFRRFAPSDADPIYDLVHDGLGTALRSWGESVLRSAAATVGGIAARYGAEIIHDLTPDSVNADGIVTIGGLRLVGGVAGRYDADPLHFQDLVIEDADLTGFAFLKVRLSNVTFRNCKLSGAAFVLCELNDVRFESSIPRGLDTLSIESPNADADVTFEAEDVRGLFLLDLAGGRWKLRGGTFEHVVVEAGDAAVEITATARELLHITVEASPNATVTSAVEPQHLTEEPRGLVKVTGAG